MDLGNLSQVLKMAMDLLSWVGAGKHHLDLNDGTSLGDRPTPVCFGSSAISFSTEKGRQQPAF